MHLHTTFKVTVLSATLLGMSTLLRAQQAPLEAIAHFPSPPQTTAPVQPTVDLAICLDTSGSMSGLIESAKQKLWAIVNDLALAEPTPRLRIALLTYGNDGHQQENGWVRVDCGLTDDLDLISQQLFALSTNGGTEYVGRVMQSALTQLEWTPGEDTLKLIVVAGNESADQDQVVPFRQMCSDAINQSIMVNPIYCGSPTDNLAPAWREIATLADGHFASIDHNQGTVVVSTPHDDRLAELSATINTTYIPFGVEGAEYQQRQELQDSNAASMNGAAQAARAQSKGSALYNNAMWDLVDASQQEGFALAEIAEEDFPENMQSMTLEERDAYIQSMFQQRQQIQQEIKQISEQRQEFIQQQMEKQGLDDDQAFDAVVRKAIRNQARTKGYDFQDDKPQSDQVTESEDAASAEDAETEES